jgi:hypothetical protein
MPDTEFWKWITTLGVGGVLAGFMFWFYRKDTQAYADLWKGQTEALITVVKENTAAVTAMMVTLQALHRRLDREEADTPDTH